MIDCLERLEYGRIGRYTLVRVIGRGTQYTLYQAADPLASRMVVIKVLHVAASPANASPVSDLSAAPAEEAARELAQVLEARLEREANALGRLSHPNIAAFYEAGEQDGHHYLVMEYLYGHPLRQRMDQGLLPWEEVIGILEQVAAAVDAVHAQEILHRDIRPSNVILQRDGRVKLVDFGLARQPGDKTITLMGEIVGEPAYMAPEQLRNKPATPESDLWAVGVLLYEMLAGQPPFQGANFTMVAHQVLMGQPDPVPGASPAVQAVIDRALEKDPEKRYRRAEEMVRALRKAVGNAPLRQSAAPTLPVGTRRFQTLDALPAGVKTVAFIGVTALAVAASVMLGVHLAAPDTSAPPPPIITAAPLPTPAPASQTAPVPSLVPVTSPAAGSYRPSLPLSSLGTVTPQTQPARALSQPPVTPTPLPATR